MAPGTPNFILLLVILIYTSPPIFIKIRPKLPKLAIGVVVRLEWYENGPRHTKSYFNLSYPNLHFPTNFHQNQTKIAKVCYRGDFRAAAYGKGRTGRARTSLLSD